MSAQPHDANEMPPMRVRGAAWLGSLTLVVFFGGLVSWAAMAPLSGAAIAPGVINVETKRKTVQHLEGGIVRDILVREGDDVVAGETLVHLDDTASTARISRLEGEIQSARRQTPLIDEEIDDVNELLAKGLARRPRLLALQRRRAELTGDLEEFAAQMRTAKDVKRRTEIRAPVSGIVVALQVHSTDGVIKGGEPLLYIVPGRERLVVEARVNPIDIDIVHTGLTADVRLTPYNMRNLPPVPGVVESLSADSFTDERSGQSYFLARIELDQDFVDMLDGVEPAPGMPVEVMIHTGSRTALEYFMEPVTRSFHRAFREN